MTGLWLASYLALWALFVVVCLFLIGALRQIGLIQQQLEPRPGGSEEAFPSLESDGPLVGSRAPDLTAETINGFGQIALHSAEGKAGVLLLFMSPMCRSCQDVVEPINALVRESLGSVLPIVLMRADEPACRAFLSVFPLRASVVSDKDRMITMSLNVHRNPFGLLYDEHGVLVRKGVVTGSETLLALLGDSSAPENVRANVFPRPEAPTTLTRADG